MVTATVDLGIEPDAAFALFADELELSLRRSGGAGFEPGPDGGLTAGGEQVARVTVWKPGERLVLEWDEVDWASGGPVRAEATFEEAGAGTRLSVTLEGWGSLLDAAYGEDAREPLGWFVDTVAGPLLGAASPGAVAGWITDRIARRPSGTLSREVYRDPTEHRPGFRDVLGALELTPDDRLLEIGCGGGALLHDALQSGCTAAAIDHSDDMLRVAGEQNADAIAAGRLRLVQADAAELPFDDGEFTCVAMTYVFFFLTDPVGVLRECRRVLAAGGRLGVATSPPELRGTPAAPDPIARSMRLYEDTALEQLARDAGFEQVAVSRPDGGQLLVARRS